VRTIEFLSHPGTAGFLVLGFLAGLGVVVMCGVLSVLVVVKKLGFAGQGISHSAFGGVGVAAMLAALGALPQSTPSWIPDAGGPGLAQLLVILLFCLGAAWGIARVSDRRTVREDTAIGLFLVASMALGAVLTQTAQGVANHSGRAGLIQSWESILFGSVLAAGRVDVVVAWIVAAAVLISVWWIRRPLLLWAFDEESATAFGVEGRKMRTLLMLLLALAIVVAMKLAGVVLATALLVLPGATALKLSDRLKPVTLISIGCGVFGLIAGLVASVELDWQPGPCVVLVMTALFGAAMFVSWVRSRSASTIPA